MRPAHRDSARAEPRAEEWLLIEWPHGEAEPTKYWLSNLPQRTALKRLVHTTKARWVIERDYQDLKQEIGLGHYEGGTGAAFIITPASRSQPTASSSPSAAFSPLSTASPANGPTGLRYPRVSSPAAPPVRPERHVAFSIASVRRRLTVALVQTLPRCPCCLTTMGPNRQNM